MTEDNLNISYNEEGECKIIFLYNKAYSPIKTSFILEEENKVLKTMEKMYEKTNYENDNENERFESNVHNDKKNNFKFEEANKSLCLSVTGVEDNVNYFNKTKENSNLHSKINHNINYESSQHDTKFSKHKTNKSIIIHPSILQFPVSFPGEVVKKSFKLINLTNQKLLFKLIISNEKNLVDLFKRYFNNIIEAYESNKINNAHIQYKCFKFDSCLNIKMDNNCLICNLTEYEEQNLVLYFETPSLPSKDTKFGLLELQINDTIEDYIPILVTIEVPKLVCLREIYTPNAVYPLLSFKIKIQNKGQKFNIPFKNLSIKDMTIDFEFENNMNKRSQNIISYKNNFYECQLVCFPSTIHIEPQSSVYLEIICKVQNYKSNEQTEIYKKDKERIRKILVGKVKNTSVTYTFFIELNQ